jgi:hypothetical protein
MRESTAAQSLFDGLDVRGIIGWARRSSRAGSSSAPPISPRRRVAAARICGSGSLAAARTVRGHWPSCVGARRVRYRGADRFVGCTEESANGGVGFGSGDGCEAFLGGLSDLGITIAEAAARAAPRRRAPISARARMAASRTALSPVAAEFSMAGSARDRARTPRVWSTRIWVSSAGHSRWRPGRW